jgi:hypothetical protein
MHDARAVCVRERRQDVVDEALTSVQWSARSFKRVASDSPWRRRMRGELALGVRSIS